MRPAVDQERAAFRGRGRHARPARRAGRPVQGRERQSDGIQTRQTDQERGVPVRQGLRRIRLGHGVVPRRLGARAAHGPRFRGPGRGPRALRRRGMRQDAHGDRHGHAGVREGHAGEVLHRVVAGDAFAAGEGREPARRGTARDRPRQAAGHRRAGLSAHRHRRGQTPVPSHRGFLREAERGVHHEPGVRTVGRGVRRRRHGRRGHRSYRASRKDRQVPWRVVPQQPLPDEINEKSGTNPAAGDGVHFERRQCSD